MGLCDLSVASPLLLAVLSGGFQKVDAYTQLKRLNEDCVDWLDEIESFSHGTSGRSLGKGV